MKKKKPKEIRPMTPEMVQMANAKLFEYIRSHEFQSLEEINEFMQKNVVGKRIDEIIPLKKGRKTNIEKSDDLMYEAYDSEPRKGLKLAREALQLNPDNVRALNYIADKTESIHEAITWYKQAMETGAKLLGERFFKENKGHFWAMHETRPYMTARLCYADCLYALNRVDEGIEVYEDLLELNPDDNQGVRYILSGILLREKKYDSYFRLYLKYQDEETAFWLFNHALFLFATEGATQRANDTLKKADQENKHILKYMTGRKKISIHTGDYYRHGEEDEAAMYLTGNFAAWKECAGTMRWLTDFMNHQNQRD